MFDVPESYLNGRPASDFCVYVVEDDSMYPIYLHGDRVICLRQTGLPQPGRIVLFRCPGILALRVISTINANGISLTAYNPAADHVFLNPGEMKELEVIGIPKMVIREID